jgi:predicted alpha-1,2-mannosidase
MTSAGWFTDRGARVYFYAVVDGGFASFGTWGDAPPVAGQGHAAGVDLGAWFAPTRNPATLKVGISRVSIDGAQANLAAEDGPDIDTIAERARDTWSQALDPFDVPDATEGERAIFYTGVYHLLQMPTIQGDVDGEYLGFDEQIHRAAGFDFYSDMSLWDTYRTAHPAYTLFYPQYASDFATSLLHMAQEGGAFPRWPAANWEGGSMIGQPADIVLADTWIKGVQDWDMDSAWPLLRAQARGEGSYAYNGRPGVLEMDEYGYLPEDLVEHSVALTQELDWADDALANLATARGDTDDADYFEQRSYGYQNQWDPDEGFFHARYSDGTFDSGLNPLAWEDEFVEGNAWQYLWMPPTHADATAELLGGQEAARARLETFFENAVEEGLTPAPALYYWHGNEPDMHAAFLFALWGDRDATVRWQRWIEDERYAATPEGLAGNDDGGTLSAWYLFSTFGFYPLSGTDEYVIGAPRWAEASFRVGDGRFTVRREGTGSHVVEVRLNGVPLDRPVLHHQELVAGGELVVVLTE